MFPRLNIIDKENLSMIYCRYVNPVTKKQEKIGARYGKRHSKEAAYSKICMRREELWRELDELIRSMKQVQSGC